MSVKYTAYEFTKAYIQIKTKDGRVTEYPLSTVPIVTLKEETREYDTPVSLQLPSFFSFSFTWQLPRQIRVGPFLMPFPPPDRMN